MDEVEKLNELITDDYSALGHDEMHVDDLRDGMVWHFGIGFPA